MALKQRKWTPHAPPPECLHVPLRRIEVADPEAAVREGGGSALFPYDHTVLERIRRNARPQAWIAQRSLQIPGSRLA